MLAKYIDLEIFKDWMLDNKQLSEATINSYKGYAGMLSDENINIEDISSVNTFIVNHCWKKNTYAAFYAVKMYLEYKIEDKVKKKEIIEGLIKVKMKQGLKRARKHLEFKQLCAIINKLELKKHFIVAYIQLVTGARVGDIMRVTKGNIIEDKLITKKGVECDTLKILLSAKGGKKKAVVIMDKWLIDDIKKFIENPSKDTIEGYYFLERFEAKGESTIWKVYRQNYKMYSEDLKSATEKAKIDKTEFSSHDFRRLFARRSFKKYMDIERLKKQMGHSRLDTTIRYLESTGADVEQDYAELQGYD